MPHSDRFFDRTFNVTSYSTSTTFIVRLHSREHQAWERLKQIFGLLVLSWCRPYPSLQQSDRQDIFQDVFLTAYQKIEQFHKEEGQNQSFRGWLKSITNSRINDYLRKKQKQPQLLSDTRMELVGTSLQVEPAHDESVVEQSERLQIYRRALEIIRNDFEEQTWNAFIRMVTSKGMTSREVGEELGMTPAAVRRAKSKVIKRIREEFGDVLK
jgi:RNA polymerase sigma-70 factor (ECF subfamily)